MSDRARVYLLMGVAGCGKTTVGRLLALKLALPFYDADDFHSRENIGKMKHGIPLDDDERMPWLNELSANIARWNTEFGAVLACSALKETYRQILSGQGREDVVFIHLVGNRDLLRTRLEERGNHYFPPALLESQLDILEAPTDAVTVRIDATPDAVVREILKGLAFRGLLQQTAAAVLPFNKESKA